MRAERDAGLPDGSQPRGGAARGAGSGVITVVKANAYGHGSVQVAKALEAAGADLLACADIEEGATLRAAGVTADILVFGALSVSDLDGLFDRNCPFEDFRAAGRTRSLFHGLAPFCPLDAGERNGSLSWTRTSDHSINSRMLYQLSYQGALLEAGV